MDFKYVASSKEKRVVSKARVVGFVVNLGTLVLIVLNYIDGERKKRS